MKIRFQVDADLKHAIVTGVLRRGAAEDFRRGESVPLEGLDDRGVLELAAEDGRVLVSHDVNTMTEHFRSFIQMRRSPGLILVPQRRVTIASAIDSLMVIWEVLDATELENRICLIPSLTIL